MIVAAILLILFGFLILGANFLLNSNKVIETSPNVFDLQDYISTAKASFQMPQCKSSNCFADLEFDDSSWFHFNLKQNLRAHPEFSQKGGSLLIRIKFNLPTSLADSNEALAISLRAIFLKKYKYYLNGILLGEFDGKEAVNQAGIFGLPRHLLNSEAINCLTILAEYDNESWGITHLHKNLIGAKHILEKGYIASERASNTYYLLFTVLKMGIFVLFSILYLFGDSQEFLKYFLGFAFCISIDGIFVTNLLPDFFSFPLRAFSMFNLQFLGFIFLWILVESMLASRYRFQKLIMTTMWLIVNLLIYFNIKSFFNIKTIDVFKIHQIFLLEIVGFICFVLWREFKCTNNNSASKSQLKQFIFIFVFYFIATIVEQFGGSVFTQNHRHPIDVLFFFGVAYVTFQEFAINKARAIEYFSKYESQKDDADIGRSITEISHDLRKPFSSFKIALNAIKDSNYEPQIIDKIVLQSLKNIDFAQGLIESILDKKRKDISSLKIHNLSDFIEQIEVLNRDHLASQNIQLNIKNQVFDQILVDHTKLLSVFQNLIKNAEEALEQKQTKMIWIHTNKFKTTSGLSKCKLIVGNNGPAIPDMVLKKIFNEQISFGKENGTGIGLAAAAQIIKSHNGEIKVRNLSYSKGVEFEIDLYLYPEI